MQITSEQFRKVLGRFATGVTVLTTSTGAGVHGMTANAFMSVSLSPPLVVVSVDRAARMHGLLRERTRYGINILRCNQKGMGQHFAGRPSGDVQVQFRWMDGVPLIEGALACVISRVVDVLPAGDHTLFVSEVEWLDSGDGMPLIFYSGRYFSVGTEV